MYYTNPIFDEDFPDPAVLHASDGWYYGYATQTLVEGRTFNIQVARSRDLIEWEHLGDALPVKPRWADRTQQFWAPHVVEHDGTFYMYYSSAANKRLGMCIAAATATHPAGPFVDCGKPLVSGGGFVHIDPMAFDDPGTGKRLLYWGSGFQPIRVQELAPDRVSFAPGSKPVTVLRPDRATPYERLIEASWVIERDGFYYLLYSGDNCCGDGAHYAVMVARSESATGPFVKRAKAGNGYTDSVILQHSDCWLAPGHHAIIRDKADDDCIIYHAIDCREPQLEESIPGDRDTRRILLMDRLIYRDGWPCVEGQVPSSTPQQPPLTG